MIKFKYTAILLAGAFLTGCQDKDIEINDPVIAPMSDEELTGNLVNDDYVWTWSPRSGENVQVSVVRNGQVVSSETCTSGSFTHHNIETKVPYTYIFKLTDGKNFSKGVIKSYTRQGASPVGGIVLTQIEKENAGYDAYVEWTPSDDATELTFSATAAGRNVNATLSGNATSYLIENVKDGEEWNVTVTANNADGKSLPASGSLRIGKTAVGFLSEYPTEADLIANGDDDEACAWLWLKSEYPAAKYIYFGDITSVETLRGGYPYFVAALGGLSSSDFCMELRERCHCIVTEGSCKKRRREAGVRYFSLQCQAVVYIRV